MGYGDGIGRIKPLVRRTNTSTLSVNSTRIEGDDLRSWLDEVNDLAKGESFQVSVSSVSPDRPGEVSTTTFTAHIGESL